MVVGWFAPRYGAEWISQEFENQGYDVIRIAADLDHPKRCGHFDYHVMFEQAHGRHPNNREAELAEAYQIQMMKRRFKIQPLIEKFKADELFFIQNKMAWDFDQVTILNYYYHTDIITTNLPLHAENITGFFSAYYGGHAEVKDAHQYEAMHWLWNRLIPYGVSPAFYDQDFSWTQRPYFCGFMGSWQQNPHAENELKQHIYDLRKHYLDVCQGLLNVDGDHPEFILQDFHTYPAYIQFLQSCKCAINIPGTYGRINQRQFEILAAGALLIQWDYPELKAMGFENGKNCYLFRNDDELALIFQLIKKNPTLVDKVRLAGIELGKHQLWKDRAREFLARMHTLSPQEIEVKESVDFQRKEEIHATEEVVYPALMFQVPKKMERDVKPIGYEPPKIVQPPTFGQLREDMLHNLTILKEKGKDR